jgi:hypothetical protein
LAPRETELNPRESAVRFTAETRWFGLEASVYRLLKAHDLITSPAYIVKFWIAARGGGQLTLSQTWPLADARYVSYPAIRSGGWWWAARQKIRRRWCQQQAC